MDNYDYETIREQRKMCSQQYRDKQKEAQKMYLKNIETLSKRIEEFKQQKFEQEQQQQFQDISLKVVEFSKLRKQIQEQMHPTKDTKHKRQYVRRSDEFKESGEYEKYLKQQRAFTAKKSRENRKILHKLLIEANKKGKGLIQQIEKEFSQYINKEITNKTEIESESEPMTHIKNNQENNDESINSCNLQQQQEQEITTQEMNYKNEENYDNDTVQNSQTQNVHDSYLNSEQYIQPQQNLFPCQYQWVLVDQEQLEQEIQMEINSNIQQQLNSISQFSYNMYY